MNKSDWRQRSNRSAVPTDKSKRGALAPLLTEEQKAAAGIQELSYDFSCRIIRLFSASFQKVVHRLPKPRRRVRCQELRDS